MFPFIDNPPGGEPVKVVATTTTARVRGLHQAQGLDRNRRVEPVGWTPARPAGFDGDAYTLDGGAVWGPHREEAELVYFGGIGYGEVKEVALDDVGWFDSGAYRYLEAARPE